MKTPKAPDPIQTAQVQGQMNRDAAISQQTMNMIDQETPWGSQTYTPNGFNFSASPQGQDVWYNSKTGEYSQSAPKVVGYNEVSTPSVTTGQVYNRNGEYNGGATTGGVSRTPIYEDGWEQQKGFLNQKFKSTVNLSPQQQAIFDQTQGAELNLATLANERSDWLKGYLGKEMDFSGLPALRTSIGNGFSGDIGGSYRTSYDPGYTTDLGSDWKTSYAGADDFSADRQRYEDAVRARMSPDLAKTRAATETQLIGRGLRPGTAAYNSEMDRIMRGENDASIAAILAGGDEQARMVGMARDAATFGNNAILSRAQFGNDAIAGRFAAENAASLGAAGFRNDAALTGANFENNARAQGMQELYAARNQPLQEISALLSGSQVQMPQFASTPTASVADVPYAGLVAQKYQADQQAASARMGGLFGLLSNGIGLLSDRRAKTDIKRIGTLRNGLPWYSFRYFWDADHVPNREGVMADEVRVIKPEAVIPGRNGGFDAVDYSMILGAA